MDKKQLQCTNCPISPEVQAIGQWNLVSPQKITWETFFLKYDTQNVVEKLVPETFLKNQNRAYFWIKSLKFISFALISCPCGGLSRDMETMVQATCFYVI